MEKIDITAHLFWAIIHSGVWSETVITSSNISVSSSSPFSLIFPNKNPVRFRKLSSSSESAILAQTREELWECRTVPVSLVQDEEMTSREGCCFRTATKTAKTAKTASDPAGVLPYITYTGMWRPTGLWFWSSWFIIRTGYPFQMRFLERDIIFNKMGNKKNWITSLSSA